jgi:hypothetical protein
MAKGKEKKRNKEKEKEGNVIMYRKEKGQEGVGRNGRGEGKEN